MDFYQEALDRFGGLLQQAKGTDIGEPTAFTLATADAEGRPSARTVLLKGYDDRGFVFYTNLNSRKGRQLAVNPHVALCFHWQPLLEQVLIEGVVEPVSSTEADAYWASRPRESQIGGWASRQSEPLADRTELEKRVSEYEAEFQGREIPRPPHWSGYRVEPAFIEFWTARPGRLHDRVRFYADDGGEWRKVLLNP